MRRYLDLASLAILFFSGNLGLSAENSPDLIVHSGKILTVDGNFHIAEAMSIRDGRVVQVGTNDQITASRGPQTEVIDLQGQTILPGLIDSHVHPADASMVEFDHPVPEMRSVEDVLDYLRSRVAVTPEGEWIVVRQVFITRLKEPRYPSKSELDAVAPRHPVVFSTGPDASANSLALQRSGIDRDFQVSGAGKIERDSTTGEPTGILRSATRYLKIQEKSTAASLEVRDERLIELLNDYRANGITCVIDRATSEEELEQYRRLLAAKKLPIRLRVSRHLETDRKLESILADIESLAKDPLCRGDGWLRVIGIKTFLDGGMLTGSAYMQDPWGVSRIYGIDDADYRGLRYLPEDLLIECIRACIKNDLQFTAHSVGDGAVAALLDAYAQVHPELPPSSTHCCISHSNFMSAESIKQAASLQIALDIQPAWLYLDTRTLSKQFGEDRLKRFQPLRSLFEAGVIVGGGSDHMQKLGATRSINPYHPFLGMWIAVTRQPRDYPHPLHPQECLTREQVIRMYTTHSAYLARLDHQVGSLEPGKQADFILVDRDPLTCETDHLKDTRVLAVYIDGKRQP